MNKIASLNVDFYTSTQGSTNTNVKKSYNVFCGSCDENENWVESSSSPAALSHMTHPPDIFSSL